MLGIICRYRKNKVTIQKEINRPLLIVLIINFIVVIVNLVMKIGQLKRFCTLYDSKLILFKDQTLKFADGISRNDRHGVTYSIFSYNILVNA